MVELNAQLRLLRALIALLLEASLLGVILGIAIQPLESSSKSGPAPILLHSMMVHHALGIPVKRLTVLWMGASQPGWMLGPVILTLDFSNKLENAIIQHH